MSSEHSSFRHASALSVMAIVGTDALVARGARSLTGSWRPARAMWRDEARDEALGACVRPPCHLLVLRATALSAHRWLRHRRRQGRG
eukprot:scaffold220744_cov36-Tisochrysis_lutea.AAC.1